MVKPRSTTSKRLGPISGGLQLEPAPASANSHMRTFCPRGTMARSATRSGEEELGPFPLAQCPRKEESEQKEKNLEMIQNLFPPLPRPGRDRAVQLVSRAPTRPQRVP